MTFDAKKVKNEIVKWIQDFFYKNGKDCNAVVGISGGKDSSVVAALCVEALGKDRVIGVLMPQGNQPDIDYSKMLCDHLGIVNFTVDIFNVCRNIKHQVKDNTGGHWSAQSSTNLPARIRMAVLYAVSQTVNGRVANTCNLSEDWVGYATRYGDAAGDFSPLSRLTVTEVKAIGRELGLPSELVDKVPTDGLCGKTDEDNLGFTYDMLDRYIRTGEIESEELKQKIDTMHKKNLFKLALMPSFEYTNPVEAVVLDDKQTGYDIVSEYIKKYWEHHCTEDVIVSIEISRDGKNYERLNEVASPYDMYDVEYLNDWWEGEKYIRVTGIQGISDIKIKKL
jgi:NAD+ synthase